MKGRHTIIILIFCLYAFQCLGQSNDGSYKLKVNILEQIDDNFVRADFNYHIELPQQEGYFCLALPFGMNQGSDYIVDPTSTNNLILVGFFRPANNSGLLQIHGSSQFPTKLKISFKNITIPVTPTPISKDQVAVNLTFGESTKRIREQNSKNIIVKPTELVIYSGWFVNSSPSPKIAEREGENTITIPTDFNVETQGIIFYLAKEKKRVSLFLIAFLLLTGCLLGIFTAPKISTTFTKALILGIVCLVIIIGTPVVTHKYIMPLKDITDTTTIVTLGTLIGLFFGLLLYSIKVIFNYYKSKKGG